MPTLYLLLSKTVLFAFASLQRDARLLFRYFFVASSLSFATLCLLYHYHYAIHYFGCTFYCAWPQTLSPSTVELNMLT